MLAGCDPLNRAWRLPCTRDFNSLVVICQNSECRPTNTDWNMNRAKRRAKKRSFQSKKIPHEIPHGGLEKKPSPPFNLL
ncbi:hypothetical protein shim_37270 [Shimia sp. SK013]|nr:hypothetical protein shim_37270 [Shimia sp. SK013]